MSSSKSHGNFVLILPAVWSVVLKSDYTAAQPEIGSCVWIRRSLFQERYYSHLLARKMIPPSGNGSCWWRRPSWFCTFNEEVRMGCVFCASESLNFFSWQPQTCAQNMIARTSWRESKLLKSSYGDDCFYKYGHFQLSIGSLELLSGICPPEGIWDIFSSWAQKKGKRKVSKARALPKWDLAPTALAIAIAAGMLRNGARTTELAVVGLMWFYDTLQSHLSVMWGSAYMKS